MRTVAFALQKGGVGKTTTAVTCAHQAAEAGRRVLLVDADPQGSASSWLLTEAPAFELADVLPGRVTLGAAVTPVAGLDLLATVAIGGGLRAFADNALERTPYAFADLRDAAERAGYDLVVVDTSPANGRLERAVLVAVDEVVPVLLAEAFSVDGLETHREFLAEVRRGYRATVASKRLVLNCINASFRRHAIYRAMVQQLGAELYEIPQDSALPEAQMVHTPAPATSRAVAALRTLAVAL